MQTINKNNKKQQTVKSRSYHIIREHLMFNKKNHKAYKHMENYGIFKVKKEFNRNCFEKYLMADILDKDF